MDAKADISRSLPSKVLARKKRFKVSVGQPYSRTLTDSTGWLRPPWPATTSAPTMLGSFITSATVMCIHPPPLSRLLLHILIYKIRLFFTSINNN